MNSIDVIINLANKLNQNIIIL